MRGGASEGGTNARTRAFKRRAPVGFSLFGTLERKNLFHEKTFRSLGGLRSARRASRLADPPAVPSPTTERDRTSNAIDLRPNASTSSHDQSTWSRSRYAPPGTSPPGARIAPAAASISASVRVGAGSTPTETSYGRDATGLRRERGVASSNPEGGSRESSSLLFCVVKNRPTFATARVSDAFFEHSSSSFAAARSSRTRGAARILASTRRRASSLERGLFFVGGPSGRSFARVPFRSSGAFASPSVGGGGGARPRRSG